MSYNPEARNDLKFNEFSRTLAKAVDEGKLVYNLRETNVYDNGEKKEKEIVEIKLQPSTLSEEHARKLVKENLDSFINTNHRGLDAEAEEIVFEDETTYAVYSTRDANNMVVEIEEDVISAEIR